MNFFLGKTARAFLGLALSVVVVFVALRVAGDPASILLPEDASPETISALRARWGLDQPLTEQFLRYVGNLLHGDFGYSMRNHRPVIDLITARLPMTLALGSLSLVIAIVVGVPMGIAAALKQREAADRIIIMAAVVGYALPNFFLGVLLILIFAMQLQWLPSSGSGSLLHLLLPAVTLGTSAAGILARFSRSAMLETLRQPYMRAALARGFPKRRAVIREALPNAAIPVVTVLGFMVGGVIGGAVVTETLFAWPGVGQLLVTSVSARDLSVVQAIILMVAVSMVATNLMVDLLYGILDPRIRQGAMK